MNIDAMKELLAAVEADDAFGSVVSHSLEALPDHCKNAMSAYLGDMNAALALHGALVPRQAWQIWQSVDGSGYGANFPNWDTAYATTPARALLIATLRGKIAEMEGATT